MSNNHFKDILDRARRLQEFEVQVAVPKDFRFKGTVPYDMEIVGDQAFVTVLAETIEEATTKAREFFTND
jgi:hypothetical protein